MAQPHLTYPDLALDKFSGTDPDRDADALSIQWSARLILLSEQNQTPLTQNMLSIFSEKRSYFPQ